MLNKSLGLSYMLPKDYMKVRETASKIVMFITVERVEDKKYFLHCTDDNLYDFLRAFLEVIIESNLHKFFSNSAIEEWVYDGDLQCLLSIKENGGGIRILVFRDDNREYDLNRALGLISKAFKTVGFPLS